MRLLFILLIIHSGHILFGYELQRQYRNYTVNDGLPSAQVYQIIEDRKGYIWFGTDRGLVRYNGYEFETFTVKDGLSIDVVFHLDEGPDGKIWCYGKDQKMHYYENGKFHPFKFNDSLVKFSSVTSNLLQFDFSEKGFNLTTWDLTPESKVRINYSLGGKLNLNQSDKFAIYDDAFGLSISGKGNKHLRSILINSEPVPILDLENSKRFLSVVKIRETYYLSIGPNLYKYHPLQDTMFVVIDQFDDLIYDLKVDGNDNLYVSHSNTGLWYYPNGNAAQKKCLLPNARISNVMIDRNGGIWAGTLFKGLFYFESEKHNKLKLENDRSVSELLGFEDKIFYLSQEQKPYELKKTGDEPLIESKKSAVDFELTEKGFVGLSNNRSIAGIFINTQTNEYSEEIISKRLIYTSNGYYAIGPSHLIYFNHVTDTLEFYRTDLYVNCAVDNPYYDLIVGTDDGVKTFMHHDSVFVRIYLTHAGVGKIYDVSFEDYAPDIPFFRGKVRDMCNIGDSLIIFGSAENGVYIQRTNQNDIWLKKEDGLLSNAISKVYFKDGYLIVISNKGVSVITQKNGIVNYTRRNGLLSNQIYEVAVLNDTLWTNTDRGVSLFPLKERQYKEIPLYVTDVNVNEKSQPLKNDYNLTYSQKTVDISFEALSYIQEGNVNYKYQLKGVDEHWVSTKSRTVRYTNLPAGEMSFWISVQNIDKTWSSPVRFFTIYKSKPFWQTIYFLAGVSIIFFGLTWVFFTMRFRRVLQKDQDKLQVLNLERKTLQAQMNPHFIFNSLTSLQNLIIQNNAELANEYLGKFARLTRIALQQSTQNWVRLADEIKLLEHYIQLEQIRFPDHFSYEFEPKLENRAIYVPPFLIQPFIENAIIHGLVKKKPGGKIEISIDQVDFDRVEFTVRDNGIGRQASRNKPKKHQSLGIRLIKERLSLLLNEDGVEIEDITDENNNSIGTQVKILVPFKTKLDESINY